MSYSEFLKKVSGGETKMHADTLMPYELVEPYLHFSWRSPSFMRDISEEEKAALNTTWSSLSAFSNAENALAIIDTSGSMYGGGKPLPAAVALSLGLYFAEHNTGAFRNHFIEFSCKPQLIEIKGETFADRLRYPRHGTVVLVLTSMAGRCRLLSGFLYRNISSVSGG